MDNRLREMIKSLISREWIPDYEYGAFCPFCDGLQPIDEGRRRGENLVIVRQMNLSRGHEPDCLRLKAVELLAEFEDE
jgi:hypothetical protein